MIDNRRVEGSVELDSHSVHGDPANCAEPAFHGTYLQRDTITGFETMGVDDHAATVGRYIQQISFERSCPGSVEPGFGIDCETLCFAATVESARGLPPVLDWSRELTLL
jgi:hypothetical protein